MDYKGLAIVIAAIGTLGIPLVLVLTTVGGLLFGFALWSILGFLSRWMVPLIFAGVGLITLIELAHQGLLGMLIGSGVMLFTVFFGYALWSGAFSGPANTYNLLLSVSGSSPPVAPIDSGIFATVIVLALLGLAYVGIREYD
jgi:hypothetical protein